MKTITPKKVFVNRTKKDGTPYEDGVSQVVLIVPSTTGEEMQVRGFCRQGDVIPKEGEAITLDIYKNDYGYNFKPASQFDLINSKLDKILAFLDKEALSPKEEAEILNKLRNGDDNVFNSL